MGDFCSKAGEWETRQKSGRADITAECKLLVKNHLQLINVILLVEQINRINIILQHTKTLPKYGHGALNLSCPQSTGILWYA